MSFKDITNQNKERLWSLVNTLCIDDQEKKDLLQAIVIYGHFARRLCKNDHDYYLYSKESLDGLCNIIRQQTIIPSVTL